MNINKLFNLFFFPYLCNAYIYKKPIKSNLNGFELGIATYTTGILMDNTISKKSLAKLNTCNKDLYTSGMKTSLNNLLLYGPIFYLGVDNLLINDHTSNANLVETIEILLTHSVGYYCSHRLMHRSDLFRKYHNYHHKFNETLIPSIGNSVSIYEFTFAYMSPFIISASIFNPNINSFNLAILIVSFMNLVIHTPELSEKKWSNYFVSPKTHLNHHQGKNKNSTYSAPTLNLEFIFNKFKSIFE